MGMAKTTPNAHTSEARKSPVLPGMTTRLAEVALQQQVVASIGLPGDIEYVANDRNRPNQHADNDVDRHADRR